MNAILHSLEIVDGSLRVYEVRLALREPNDSEGIGRANNLNKMEGFVCDGLCILSKHLHESLQSIKIK